VGSADVVVASTVVISTGLFGILFTEWKRIRLDEPPVRISCLAALSVLRQLRPTNAHIHQGFGIGRRVTRFHLVSYKQGTVELGLHYTISTGGVVSRQAIVTLAGEDRNRRSGRQ
jgi:hypothetical protein